MNALQVLLVTADNSHSALRAALETLEPSHRVSVINDPQAAADGFAGRQWDAVLLDSRALSLDVARGLIEQIRLVDAMIPIIVLADAPPNESAPDASENWLRIGATDLLLDADRSPVDSAERLRLMIRLHRAIADRDQTAALLDAYLLAAPMGISIVDPQFRFVRVNETLARINGFPVQAHLGKTVAELLPEIWQKTEADSLRVRQTRKPVLNLEVQGTTPAVQGETRDWACSLFPLIGKRGEFLGIGTVVKDITDLKKTQRELTAARDAAEAANRAKDQFLSMLSHELRTPLSPVLSTVTALQAEPNLSPELQSALQMIRRNVELEARLIDDLLDLTRISKGKLRLNLATVDAHTAITSAVAICQPEIDSKRLQVSLDLSAAEHHVHADEARLQQVFWNLIKNAVKFTPADGTISIGTENLGPRIRITIRDSGVGIDAASLPNIFFAFELPKHGSSHRFGGLGLGLSISKSLIDMHGGELTAASEGKDRGSLFTIELPTVAAPAPPPKPGRDGASNNGKRSIRILMVDDHADTSAAMKRLLEKLGYQVDLADSVESALAFSDRNFDLLISDIGLPDGSGLDLIRQLTQRRPVKGIALSGFGMEDDIRRSKAAGFLEHLTKPVNFARLEAVIQRLTQ
jgi:PAS domain S-box-containing protein